MYAWINSHGAYPNTAANKRGTPSVLGPIVGSLSALGELVILKQHSIEADGIWTNFISISNGQSFWIRNDVFDGVNFLGEGQSQSMIDDIPEKVILDIKFHSQNDQDSNASPNDCGPASSTMMLEHAGTSVTVNEFMKTAGINHTGFTNFNDNIRGLEKYKQLNGDQIDAEYRRPTHISNILREIGKNHNPVFCLVYYHHLNPNKKYGHFLVAVGYELINDRLNIVSHDPNRVQYMRFDVVDFANAIGYVNGSGNMPFQGLMITNYPPYKEIYPEPEPEPEPIPNPIPDPEPDPSEGSDGADGLDYEKMMLEKMDKVIQLLTKQNQLLIDLYNK